MTFEELSALGEKEKKRHAQAVDDTLAALKELYESGGKVGSASRVLHRADRLHDFRFELLDFLDEHHLR